MMQIGDLQPQPPVEGERPRHVRDDESENVQSSAHAATLRALVGHVLDESDIGRPGWCGTMAA